jgi:hypothetical protein
MATEEPIPILSPIPQMSVNSIPCGNIEFYPDAEDFTITDGEFNTVRGSVYIGPALQEAPQQKSSHSTGRVTYFPRAKGFIISGGNFMTIGGNLYDTRPPKIPPTSEVPRRDVHNTSEQYSIYHNVGPSPDTRTIFYQQTRNLLVRLACPYPCLDRNVERNNQAPIIGAGKNKVSSLSKKSQHSLKSIIEFI